MSKIYVYSTLTNSQKYTNWVRGAEGQLPQQEFSILIKGGANLSRGAFPHFETPRGVVTIITEEELAQLETNHDFNAHIKNGFVTVRKDSVDPEVAVAAGMKQQDESAPYTPNSPELHKADNADGPGLKVAAEKAA